MKRALAAIPLLLLTAIACQQEGEVRVEEPVYGKDACAECSSTIHDPKFAAYYQAQGTRKVFDDPGCLFRSLRKESAQSVEPVFHEHGGTRWVSGSEVFFAKTPASESPQGYGWAAYASFGDAQTAVTSAGAGEILSLAQAKEKIGADSPP